jgi:glycosyltransferase involved in cell wall biosynthesis
LRIKVHECRKGYALKILIVSDAWHPQVNGVVRTYEYLQKELETMGYTVKVIGPADFPHSFPMPGYGEIRLVPFPYNLLRRMIMEYDPGVLHIATEGPLGIAARRYAKNYGVEFTSCYHTHFPDYAAKRVAKYLPFLREPVRKLGITFIRWFHDISSCLFAATQSLEVQLRDWEFTCPIKRMTRGIDHNMFYEGEKKLFRDLPKPIALYVGRVAIEKNLEAFLDMKWEGSKIIVGIGPDMHMLKNKYPDARFTGVKTGKDLADHYRSSDLFVFPSKTDTFGMVLVEAMACGLPIAAYPVTGPIDIVTDDFLGAVDNDLGTAARRALLHGSPSERAAHARENYSWRKATEQFLETD